MQDESLESRFYRLDLVVEDRVDIISFVKYKFLGDFRMEIYSSGT
jgi:hypothetical protein